MAAHAGEPDGAELQAATLKAWSVYERSVDARYDAAAPAGTAPFFALDAFGQADWRGQARGGTIPMARVDRAAPGGPELDVPGGKIHHWTGAIFVPGVAVDEVLKRLAALAGTEQKHYADVLASRLISKADDRFQIFMKIRRSKVITVTYNTEHDVRYRRLGTARASARSIATRIAQLEEAGTPQEHELKAGLRRRISVAAECLLALRDSPRRRADRMRVGEPQPGRPVRAPALCHGPGRRARARVARTHAHRPAHLPHRAADRSAALINAPWPGRLSGRRDPRTISGTSTIRTPAAGDSTAATSARTI